jgi:hypothetical protein
MTDSLPQPLTSVDLSATRLVNKEYYDAIDATMASKKNPTVTDEIHAMSKQGNKPYVDALGGYLPEGEEEEFPLAHLSHDITHLSARIPHSWQGELMGLAFEGGLAFGLAVRQLDAASIEIYKRGAEDGIAMYQEASAKHEARKPDVPSKRSWGIYLAAGMYLREKMDCYLAEGMENRSYEEKLQWCNAYSSKDHIPPYRAPRVLNIEKDFVKLDEENDEMYRCGNAPNALIHLSPKEWREIEAVALGMAEPEQTAYPKRLAAVKEALVHVGMFFDRPKFAEEHEAEMVRKNQHARIRASYPASALTTPPEENALAAADGRIAPRPDAGGLPAR